MSWRVLRGVLAIGLTALIVWGCSSKRVVSRDRIAAYERRAATNSSDVTKVMDVRDSVGEAERDTLKEMTVVTIDRNEAGDTVRVMRVTERTRVKVHDRIAAQRTKEEVERNSELSVDSLEMKEESVERRSESRQSGGIALSDTLKWVLGIIVGLIVLTIIIKVK